MTTRYSVTVSAPIKLMLKYEKIISDKFAKYYDGGGQDIEDSFQSQKGRPVPMRDLYFYEVPTHMTTKMKTFIKKHNSRLRVRIRAEQEIAKQDGFTTKSRSRMDSQQKTIIDLFLYIPQIYCGLFFLYRLIILSSYYIHI